MFFFTFRRILFACVHTRTHTPQAEEAAKKGPECALKNRLLFHVSHKLLDENKLMTYHQKLSDTNEDQLSLAAIHYLRSHFQEVGGSHGQIRIPSDLLKKVLLRVVWAKFPTIYYSIVPSESRQKVGVFPKGLGFVRKERS